MTAVRLCLSFSAGLFMLAGSRLSAVEFRAEAIDEATDESLAARVCVQGSDGKWHFVDSAVNGKAVVDAPEANWHQDGLLYLAHKHVPTVWTKQDVKLPRLEWRRLEDGSLESERELP